MDASGAVPVTGILHEIRGDYSYLMQSMAVTWHEHDLDSIICHLSIRNFLDINRSDTEESQVQIAYYCSINTP